VGRFGPCPSLQRRDSGRASNAEAGVLLGSSPSAVTAPILALPPAWLEDHEKKEKTRWKIRPVRADRLSPRRIGPWTRALIQLIRAVRMTVPGVTSSATLVREAVTTERR
jgi:hypothetical protein